MASLYESNISHRSVGDTDYTGKAAYEDYKRLRKENQELQAVKSNVDTLLRIEEEQQEKKQEQHLVFLMECLLQRNFHFKGSSTP